MYSETIQARTYRQLIPEITLKFKGTKNVHVAQLKDSEDAFDLFKCLYDEDTVELCETAIVLYLNNQNKSIGWFKVSQGGITQTIVDIRLILATALKCGATSLMFSHNHPAGGTTPSPEDNLLTERINTACNTLDISFLDHIIVSGDLESYYSYHDEKVL